MDINKSIFSLNEVPFNNTTQYGGSIDFSSNLSPHMSSRVAQVYSSRNYGAREESPEF